MNAYIQEVLEKVEKRDKNEIKDLLLQYFGDLAGTAPAAAGGDAVDPEKLRRIRHGLDEILTLLAKDDKK